MLSQFRTRLFALLAENQQNAVADILIQIQNAPYRYDKVLYASVQGSMSPMGLSLMAAQIVQSTEVLIGSLSEQAASEPSVSLQNPLPTIMPQAAHLKSLIAAGKTKQALDEFAEALGSTHALANDLLLLQSRYNSNKNAHLGMTITDEVHRLENNKIGAALLHYIDEFLGLK